MRKFWRRMLWKIALRILNRMLKRISEHQNIAEIKIETPNWDKKTVLIFCTENSKNIVTQIPDTIMGFHFQARIVDKIK